MKTRKKKISKSERIPKLCSPTRDVMLKMLTEMPDYINAMSRGLRFFRKDELEGIESKFLEGMSWEDIETVLSGKGTLLKYATFRKYIQDGIIPKAARYKSTENGRVAIYDPIIIRHLNFVDFFYNVTDAPMIDNLMQIIGDCEISYEEAIESVLGGSGVLCVELVREMASLGSCDATMAIEKALAKRDDKAIVLKMFNNLQNKYEKYISKDFSELEKYLASKKMLITQIPDDGSMNSVEVQS